MRLERLEQYCKGLECHVRGGIIISNWEPLTVCKCYFFIIIKITFFSKNSIIYTFIVKKKKLEKAKNHKVDQPYHQEAAHQKEKTTASILAHFLSISSLCKWLREVL